MKAYNEAMTMPEATTQFVAEYVAAMKTDADWKMEMMALLDKYKDYKVADQKAVDDHDQKPDDEE
jgi:hypothetical protein